MRYNLYILKLLAIPTILITISLTCIIWLTQALRFIDFIINRGLSIKDFTYLTILLLPSLLLIILPVSLFIAVIFTYNKLTMDSELIVMRASGISSLQLAKPTIIIGIIVTIICYFISFYLLPISNIQFKDMQNFLKNNYSSILLQEGVFNNPTDGLTVFIKERAKDGTLKGIIVHDGREKNAKITLMAENSRLVQTASGPRFYMEHGLRQEMKNGRVSWLNFDSYVLDISIYTEKTSNIKRDGDELFLSQLWNKMNDETIDENSRRKFSAEYYQRLSWPLYALALALFAVTFLLKGEYSRRGMSRRIFAVSIIAITIILSSFGLGNLIVKIPSASPILYVLVISIIFVSIFILSDLRIRKIGK